MTSGRLSSGGRLIDRTQRMRFRFNGRFYSGFKGDTLASALLASDVGLVGRSFKYHRRRGILSAGPEEPNALVTTGSGLEQTPNERATLVPLVPGLKAKSQNHWPTLSFDISALNNKLSALFPAGFYYKTFMAPRFAWARLYEPIIRRQAGLGKPPKGPDPAEYEHIHHHVDLLIAGGGIAGLQAALAAADSGASIMVLEQSGHWGGRAPVDGAMIDGKSAEAWVAETVAALQALPNVHLRLNTVVSGVYDHGFVTANEKLTPAAKGAPEQRNWMLRTKRIIVATGAIERPLMFAGNDLPGVMLASAVRDYLVNYGVRTGNSVVLVTTNDDGYRTAITLAEAGVTVPAIIDTRPDPGGTLPDKARTLGLRIIPGAAVGEAKGKKYLTGVTVTPYEGKGDKVIEEIACDCLAMAGGWSPVVHLWSQIGGKLRWDDELGLFRPELVLAPIGPDGEPNVLICGAANAQMTNAEVLTDAHTAGMTAGAKFAVMGRGRDAASAASEPEEKPMFAPLLPARALRDKRKKAFVDYQHDVKVTDIQLAAREGYESVEHAKRYTTLGMATDQGKTSNINGLAMLARTLKAPIPDVGTTTFRPPYLPVTMGAIAGSARGSRFMPDRKTPMHDWHAANGAIWEPVGLWRRAQAYLRPGETQADAVKREVSAVRNGAGILDGSTLGKIQVAGPDAGRFLDTIYTGKMSTIPVGRCRYGLICNENGFVIDDGVVARIGEEEFLCHTTSGGADRIHAMMEDWLQCEWWDWKVWTTNLTEAFAQIVVAGPRARDVLSRLGNMDIRKGTLPFLHWADGQMAGIPVRVYRISFSGELSFEIAVRANRGAELWARIIEAGKALSMLEKGGFELVPYGTDALHVLRAEKGYIIIGDETDGTVTPQDLGLGWAVSKKKDDFIGKRGLERSELTRDDRWTLVGLLTSDGSVLPDGAYVIGTGKTKNGQTATDGRVTSTYFSPTIGREIALALVPNGNRRHGQLVEVQDGKGGSTQAKIVPPCFYDPDGGELDP